MIEWLRDPASAIALDTRQHPAVISCWHGAVGLELLDHYYRWSDASVAQAIASEQRLIRIADLRDAQVPPPGVCKRLYEHRRVDLADEVTLVTFVVVVDPVVRRIVKVLQRLGGGLRDPKIVIVDSMTAALELTLARLRAERIPAPAGLDPVRYQPPCLTS